MCVVSYVPPRSKLYRSGAAIYQTAKQTKYIKYRLEEQMLIRTFSTAEHSGFLGNAIAIKELPTSRGLKVGVILVSILLLHMKLSRSGREVSTLLPKVTSLLPITCLFCFRRTLLSKI